MINRQDLLEVLQLVKPALSSKSIIAEFTHVWFDGHSLTATNDTGFGIRMPWSSDIIGGLPGTLLLGLLSNSKAKEVEFVADDKDDDRVILKMGKARAALTLLPIKTINGIYKKQDRGWLIEQDELKGKSFRTTEEFTSVLSQVMISAETPKSKIAELTGVTLIRDNGLHMFATDDDTVAWAMLKDDNFPLKEGKRITIPIPFIEQLLQEVGKGGSAEIRIYKNLVYAKGNRNMEIFSNLVTVEEPTNLLKLGKSAIENTKYVKIPARLKLALARAFSMLESSKESFVRIHIKSNVLRVVTKNDLAELKDSIALEGEVPDIETMLDPKLIKRGLPLCERMSIGKTTTVLSNKDFVYIIAAFA